MHEVTVKHILSAHNGMNLYRGCQHGCIYCDARSHCYQINHVFEDIEVKTNAPQLLEAALKSKRKPCMIGTGSMSDPYIPLEEKLVLFIDAPLERDERGVGPVRTGLGEMDAILYLVHGPEKLLMPTPARVRRSTTVPLPELLVRSLLQDPGTNGIRSCIPEGTRLNGVTVTDGTCFVDLSEQYLNDPANLRSAGRVIAATLCTLDEVDRVQILVNGAVPAEFDEDLFGILTPNEDWFL